MNIGIVVLFILVDNSIVNHKHTVTYTPSIIPYYMLVSLWICQFGEWTVQDCVIRSFIEWEEGVGSESKHCKMSQGIS